MKFAHIVPSKHLKDLDQHSDFYLVLSHLIPKDKEYTEFFKNTDKYKILDNGAYENSQPEPIKVLVDKAEMIGANEIVLPDVFKDMDHTMTYTLDALCYLQHENLMGKYKLMAVPQGKNPTEYIKCLRFFCNMPEIDVIGLSFIVIKDAFKGSTGIDEVMANRILVTNIIDFWEKRPKKEFHLLGMGNCMELNIQKRYDWIRGADSSTCFVHGMNDIVFTDEKGLARARIEKPASYFDIELKKDSVAWENVLKNMNVLRGYLHIYGG